MKLTDKEIYSDLQSVSDLVHKSAHIYFLIQTSKNGTKAVVYVGQSINVVPRLRSHAADNTKQWDSYKLLEVPGDELDVWETHYILKYTPMYNRSVKANGLIYIGSIGKYGDNNECKQIPVNVAVISGKAYLNPCEIPGLVMASKIEYMASPSPKIL